MTGAGRAGLEAWLAEDRRNRGAYLRAQAALVAMEAAVRRAPLAMAPGNDSEFGPLPGRWARRFALAAALSAVAALGAALLLRPWQAPAVAERVMRLQDGSVVTLAADAQVRVEMSAQARRIILLGGRATFRVASDRARPFVVSAGQVFAQATGTEYAVSRVGADGATVAVSEGSVLVWAGDERDQAVLLRAGGRLTLDPGIDAQGAVLPAPEVAQISLDDESLADAVVRFNRINRTQIVIADPAIGRVRIVGLFRADDPGQFARAAAAVAGAAVSERDGVLVIGPAAPAVQ